MKFAVNNDHIRFFNDYHYITLQDFLTPEQCHQLKDGIAQAFKHRLGTQGNAEELFVEGYNLHADSPQLQRLITNKSFGAVVAELLECNPLRLGPDQYLPVNEKLPDQQNDPYGEFLKKASSLYDDSCIQGIVGGLLFCVEPPESEDPAKIFPPLVTEVLLFKADKTLPFTYLDTQKKGAYYMVTFTEQVALYTRNEADPHLHELKRWGYGFGDKLKDPYFPIIIR